MSRFKQRHRDAGMTLPEILISVVLTSLLLASMTMTITVILKQSKNTTGRVNNARSEQNVNLWMPTDLASAEDVSQLPGASPCDGMPSCPAGADVGGSNLLMLTWSGSAPGPGGTAVPTLTNVSYRYVLVGSEYQMIRVACISVDGGTPSCKVNVVLHGLDPPPVGINFIPGTTPPTWIMSISQALAPGDPTNLIPADPTFTNKNGQRVVVTINGGSGLAGAGGGQNTISLSAGGTERTSTLATNSVSFNQTLTAARTRCGGNYGMVIDYSGSINRAPNPATTMATVRAAISSMIDTFAGTPVKLQLSKFGWLGAVLGADASGARYFDMLKETDVSDLKIYVNGGTTSTGFVAAKIESVNDATNWEDGLYRMFRNTDGTIQASLPQKVIFFTDGVPSYDRLGGAGPAGTSAAPAAAQNPDDTGLGQPNGSGYWQRSWNRANRIAREFGVQVDFIGVLAGADTTSSSNWSDVNAGYHLIDWKKGYHDVWEQGYHTEYQRNANVTWEQGYHTDYQRNNNIVWEKGYHWDLQRANNVVWQRNNNVVFERATTGLTYEQLVSGSWVARTELQYFSGNTTPDSTDNFRVSVTGALGGWSSSGATQSLYDGTNTTADSSDGFRTSVSGGLSGTWSPATKAQYDLSNTVAGTGDGWRTSTSGSSITPWTSITQADYNLNNTTTDATDGFQISSVKIYSTPFDQWDASTLTLYAAGNTTTDSVDGWRTRLPSASASWTSIPVAEYTASNTTPSDGADGYQIANVATAPFTLWQPTTLPLYLAGIAGAAPTGWRTVLLSPLSATWVSGITAAEYNAGRTTTPTGFQIANVFTSPFSLWLNATQAAYNAGVSGTPAGWRTYRSYTSPFSAWETTPEATYIANKPAGQDPTVTTSGWTATKVWTPPYTAYDAVHTYAKTNQSILAQLIDPSGMVPPIKDGSGNVTNAEVANMYTTAAWSDLQAALKAIALGQCGGTLTLQTRVNGTTPANDAFTYTNSIDSTTVVTSSEFRSGTFDFAITSGSSVTPEITQQNTSVLDDHYNPAGWSCKAAGLPITPTIVDVPGTPWDSIRLPISANAAVSCIQNVTWVP